MEQFTSTYIIPKLKDILTSKYLIWLALLFAAVLSLPALWRGWGFEDDALHRSFLLSASLPEALRNLYVILDPNTIKAQMDIGVLPWWTLETTKVAFFRPLAALTLWLDYQVWPDSSLLMHAHSFAWYLAVCVAVAMLYRRLMGHTLASGLAILLFALNIPHVNAVYPLAARSQLMGAVFGILAVWTYDRSTRDHWKLGLFIGPILLLSSLFSAEAGIAVLGYLAAHLLFIDRRPWKSRLLGLFPYVVAVIVWRLIYNLLGYGIWGSGFYMDPVGEPLRFVLHVVKQMPVILFGQWILPDPIVFGGLSALGKVGYWLFAVVILVLLALMLSPMFGKLRKSRFWGLSMILAVIPICGVSLASGRHLLILSVGAIALLAQFITGRLCKVERLLFHPRWKTFSLVVAVFLLSLHALVYPVVASTFRQVTDPVLAMTDLGPLEGIEAEDLIIVNFPSPGHSIYLLSNREIRHQTIPAHLRILAPGHTELEVTRLDPYTLSIRPESGFLIPTQIDLKSDPDLFPLAHLAYGYRYSDTLFREHSQPLTLDEDVDLPGLSVSVRSLTPDGRPWEAHMVFGKQLEDPSLNWLQWDWETQKYEPFPLPDIGQTVRIPGPF